MALTRYSHGRVGAPDRQAEEEVQHVDGDDRSSYGAADCDTDVGDWNEHAVSVDTHGPWSPNAYDSRPTMKLSPWPLIALELESARPARQSTPSRYSVYMQPMYTPRPVPLASSPASSS